MWDIEIDTSELERDWADACVALSDGIRAGVAKGVEEGATEARTVHRWKSQTGALEQSIKGIVLVSAQGGAEGEIVATAPHASYLEEGTPAHEIRPKFAEVGPTQKSQGRRGKGDVGTHRVALRWVDGGGTHFATVVHHPGTAPSPFLGPAALKAERVIEREVGIAEAKAAAIMDR